MNAFIKPIFSSNIVKNQQYFILSLLKEFPNFMKRIILYVFFSAFLITNVFSQKYHKQQFTLFKYHCVVDESIIKSMSELENSITCPAPSGYTKTETLLTQSIYSIIKSKMESKFGVYILPVNSYQDNGSYDSFGFPDMLINNAIRKGSTKYYFKITVHVETSSKATNNDNNLWPVVKVEIELYNKDGYQPIKTGTGISEAVGIYNKVPSVLYGLDCAEQSISKPASDSEVFLTIINDAVESALKKL